LIARRDPTCAPTKLFGADFQQKIARFRFNEVSATIDNDWSIFSLRRSRNTLRASARNTVIALHDQQSFAIGPHAKSLA